MAEISFSSHEGWDLNCWCFAGLDDQALALPGALYRVMLGPLENLLHVWVSVTRRDVN